MEKLDIFDIKKKETDDLIHIIIPFKSKWNDVFIYMNNELVYDCGKLWHKLFKNIKKYKNIIKNAKLMITEFNSEGYDFYCFCFDGNKNFIGFKPCNEGCLLDLAVINSFSLEHLNTLKNFKCLESVKTSDDLAEIADWLLEHNTKNEEYLIYSFNNSIVDSKKLLNLATEWL